MADEPVRIAIYGNREAVLMPDKTWRVACSKCHKVLGEAVHTRASAFLAARRDSRKPCAECKAAKK